jgi:hypothetical protein
MEGFMSNSNLPLWLQHHDGNIPHPTPEQVEADYQRELKAAQDAIDGKPDSKETKAMHAALMDYYGGMTLDGTPTAGQPTNAWEALQGFLARVDWNTLFIRVARLLSAAALAFLTWQYSNYFQVFGVGAMAFIGQFAIGLFFMVSIMTSTNGLQILTASLGMYLLISSF